MSSGARTGETWHHVDVANGELEPLGPPNNTRRDRPRRRRRLPFSKPQVSWLDDGTRKRVDRGPRGGQRAHPRRSGDRGTLAPVVTEFWFEKHGGRVSSTRSSGAMKHPASKTPRAPAAGSQRARRKHRRSRLDLRFLKHEAHGRNSQTRYRRGYSTVATLLLLLGGVALV